MYLTKFKCLFIALNIYEISPKILFQIYIWSNNNNITTGRHLKSITTSTIIK